MANNFNMIEHHVSALVRAVRDGETDGKSIMRALRTELAKTEREVSLETDRLKDFAKDIYLESDRKDAYEHSSHYWDRDRNKSPFDLTSDYLNFSSGSGDDVIKFGDYTNGDFKDWTS